MFKRLRLWYWKWFRPSKYLYTIRLGEAMAAGFWDGIKTAKNNNTGKVFTDGFYCTSEAAARRDFRDCYRHGDYTILSVQPEPGTLTDEEVKLLAKIARENISALSGRENLEAQDLDELDFFETAVWSLEAALEAAYKAGKEAAKK